MTELKRARKYLGDAQCNLAFVRQQDGTYDGLRLSENDVLAALSWVWDAQERDRIRRGEYTPRDIDSAFDTIIGGDFS